MLAFAANITNNSYVVPKGNTITVIILTGEHDGLYARFEAITYSGDRYDGLIQAGNITGVAKIVTKTTDNTIVAKTQSTDDKSTKVATTEFVKNAIAAALAAKGL